MCVCGCVLFVVCRVLCVVGCMMGVVRCVLCGVAVAVVIVGVIGVVIVGVVVAVVVVVVVGIAVGVDVVGVVVWGCGDGGVHTRGGCGVGIRGMVVAPDACVTQRLVVNSARSRQLWG